MKRATEKEARTDRHLTMGAWAESNRAAKKSVEFDQTWRVRTAVVCRLLNRKPFVARWRVLPGRARR